MNWAPSVRARGLVVACSRGAVMSSLRRTVSVLLLLFSDSVLLLFLEELEELELELKPRRSTTCGVVVVESLRLTS